MSEQEPPEESPYDTMEEYLASQLLNQFRKPDELIDNYDLEYIADLAEKLSREVLDK